MINKPEFMTFVTLTHKTIINSSLIKNRTGKGYESMMSNVTLKYYTIGEANFKRKSFILALWKNDCKINLNRETPHKHTHPQKSLASRMIHQLLPICTTSFLINFSLTTSISTSYERKRVEKHIPCNTKRMSFYFPCYR